ncbi:hypothetical protein M595_5341 [Lyngbya aestuarii BL J]|uniref:Uncharacterized protein n=1 Tax=Lyngbya aestuarii BL J TaxID=1348334 RepID=U7QD98_9CYAN|nr:hypothetical protein M595_5341 [Lyngbya aestuarii BL J]
MNLPEVPGLTTAEIATLKQLGAVCEKNDLSENRIEGARNRMNSKQRQKKKAFKVPERVSF